MRCGSRSRGTRLFVQSAKHATNIQIITTNANMYSLMTITNIRIIKPMKSPIMGRTVSSLEKDQEGS